MNATFTNEEFLKRAHDELVPNLKKFVRRQGFGGWIMSVLGERFSVPGAGAYAAALCAEALGYDYTASPEIDEINDILGLADQVGNWDSIRLEDRLFLKEGRREIEALYALAVREGRIKPHVTRAWWELGLEGFYGRIDPVIDRPLGRVLITNHVHLHDHLMKNPPSNLPRAEAGDAWFDRTFLCYGTNVDLRRLMSREVRSLLRETVEDHGPVTLQTGPKSLDRGPASSSDPALSSDPARTLSKESRIYFHVWYVHNPFRPVSEKPDCASVLLTVAQRMAFPMRLQQTIR